MSLSFGEHTADARQAQNERRRKVRSPESMELDLKLWRQLRMSWRNIQGSAMELGDADRVELARSEIARADAAIERLDAQLRARQP